MATVTIYRTDGTQETIHNVDEDFTYYYEQLPFSDTNVNRVDVKF